MSLSEQEQRTLREIEESLLADDPKFGASVSEPTSFGGSGGAVTLRGIALIVVGLCMLIGGVALAQQSLWFIVLSIAGFLVMFAAGVWMLRGDGSGHSVRNQYSSARAKKSSSHSGGVSGRLEENFRRRFEGR
ncbi:DUF3040 domain-containing protein [Corynebacterium yonathiae]|uniref:DUF3040 domain-containing protein n=1 Tax=Corynebacterium yonathiae TaxID=2913504 RepID=A0A9X3LXA6_9CORY|nr:DUF3040 domain-containing protein [Corynebacterium sp. BWA136]MCZ9295667.1 DUF3040 domain-containing protein [Corynebacterium yonathiae]MDK2582211.1 DUF3040 domain-containing protein [Corynebacterium sp. BWA136]